MCGRYTVTDPDGLLEAELGISSLPPGLEPRYNLAPTQDAPVVVNRAGPRRLELFRWGLVPNWAESPSVGHRMINARLETAAEKPAFREALRRRRCLVPADGFFEWKAEGGRKVPHWIRLEPARPFAFAGLWEKWRDPRGGLLHSFAILTGPPNDLVAPIHDRMPVVLPPEAYDRWLTAEDLSPEGLADLLRPPPSRGWVAVPVSPLVSDPRNDSPACLTPASVQGTLF